MAASDTTAEQSVDMEARYQQRTGAIRDGHAKREAGHDSDPAVRGGVHRDVRRLHLPGTGPRLRQGLRSRSHAVPPISTGTPSSPTWSTSGPD